MASSSEFLARIGVNTHLDAVETPYGNVVLVAGALSYLGISLIRDHSYDIDLPGYLFLAAGSTRIDLIVDDAEEVPTMVALGSSVVSIEGGNEVDIYPVPGLTDTVDGAVLEQQKLYSIVRSTPAFSSVPVLNQSIGDRSNYAAYAATLQYSDVANVHAYAANGLPPFDEIQAVLQVEYTDRSKPVQITETGFYDLPSDVSGVDQIVQAKYTLDTLFDTAVLGIASTFLYELFDERADPFGIDSEQHYGLFNNNGIAKPVAVAIHNLSQILSAPGVIGAGSLALAPVLAGLPESGHSLTLDGANNSKFIAVWAEPEIWDQDRHREIVAPVTNVTVSFGTTAALVSIYDPMVAPLPIGIYANVSAVTLGITDHPLIIQVSAGLALPPTPTPVPVPPVSVPGAASAAIEVFRFFDQRFGTHFYSASTAERDSVQASRQDLVYEGVGFGAVAAALGAAPVYRFFEESFGTHFYTASAAEKEAVIASRPDLVFEGIGFYEHTTPQAGDVAVYRLFNTMYGTHFYTPDANERATVLATRSDLVDEGVAFYAPAVD